MVPFAIAIDYSAGLPLIISAGVAMYIASKALADALVGGRPAMPGRLAVGQWLPIAILAIAAVVTHRQPLAMGLIFASSVACLSLATGAVGFIGVSIIPPSSRRSWAMLVPAALLTFLAGFRASVSLLNAGILALQGVCILLLWNDRADPASNPPPIPPAGRGIVFRAAQLLLGLMLAAVGSWFAMHGIDAVSAGSEFASTGLLTTTLLGPMLVLPIIGTGTELAQRNQSATAITSHVGVTLLNICGLLPLVVVTDVIRQLVLQIRAQLVLLTDRPVRITDFIHAAQKAFHMESIVGFPFPLAVWRVDVVMLIALGLFLLPVAIGKWSISKMQGVGLMLGYASYLILAIVWTEYSLRGIPVK